MRSTAPGFDGSPARPYSGTADGVQITAGKIQNNSVWFSVVKSGKTYACKGQIAGSTLTIYQSLTDGSQPVSVTLAKTN